MSEHYLLMSFWVDCFACQYSVLDYDILPNTNKSLTLKCHISPSFLIAFDLVIFVRLINVCDNVPKHQTEEAECINNRIK